MKKIYAIALWATMLFLAVGVSKQTYAQIDPSTTVTLVDTAAPVSEAPIAFVTNTDDLKINLTDTTLTVAEKVALVAKEISDPALKEQVTGLADAIQNRPQKGDPVSRWYDWVTYLLIGAASLVTLVIAKFKTIKGWFS